MVEVFSENSEKNKLLLQIMAFKDDPQSKGNYCCVKFNKILL